MLLPTPGDAATFNRVERGRPTADPRTVRRHWVLRTFAGLSNLPAVPQVLSRRQLAPYEGRYVAEMIEADGVVTQTVYELHGARGQLRVTSVSSVVAHLALYRKDYPLVLDAVRATSRWSVQLRARRPGRINWWLFQSALYRHHR